MKYLCAAVAGTGLFLADYPVEWPWLELVAFAPLLWLVVRALSWSEAAALGVAWSVGRTLPLAWMLHSFGLPWSARVAVAIYLFALDALFALIVYGTRRWRFGWLAPALAFAAIEWLDSLLPMWGTAHSLARPWVVLPQACSLVAWFGVPAVAFVIVALQALVVQAWQRKQPPILALAGALALAGSFMVPATRTKVPATVLKVGMVGWVDPRAAKDAEAFVHEAATKGARLVALPEAAFVVPAGGREAFEQHWMAVARAEKVFLVVPYIDRERANNRLTVFADGGEKIGEYAKYHLVPGESLRRGDGSRLLFSVDGVRVGMMICQDDNFPDIAAAYAREGAQLLVVPSFEGPKEVAPYHLRNAVLRTIENQLPLVRATAQGQSAIILAGGVITSRLADGVLIGDVPIF